MNSRLYPKRFRTLDPRLQWGLAAVWPAFLLVAAGYLLFLAVALLATDMNPVEATLIYAGKTFSALDPIITIGIGAWALFTYLYSVSAPAAQAIDRRRSLVHQGYYAFKTLLVGYILSLMPSRIPWFARAIALAPPWEDLRRRFMRRAPPPSLALTWSPGHSPLIIYE